MPCAQSGPALGCCGKGNNDNLWNVNKNYIVTYHHNINWTRWYTYIPTRYHTKPPASWTRHSILSRPWHQICLTWSNRSSRLEWRNTIKHYLNDQFQVMPSFSIWWDDKSQDSEHHKGHRQTSFSNYHGCLICWTWISDYHIIMKTQQKYQAQNKPSQVR